MIAVIVVAVYFGTRPGPSSKFPFPCLGAEGTALHIHPWLQIRVNNQTVTIPANIGIQTSITGTCFEPLHTHDASGIIHIESPDTTTIYTIGDFFKIWNATYGTTTVNGAAAPVVFDQTDILGFKNNQNQQVKLLVDGTPSNEYESLKLIPLDYCSAANGSVPPCNPTAWGNPFYPGGYQYGTGHTIVIEY